MTFEEYVIGGVIIALVVGVGSIIRRNGRQIITKLLLWAKLACLKIFPVSFNIALSIDFKEGLNSGGYFEQIKKNLDEILDSSKIGEKIRIKDFSDIKKFKNRKEAEKFRGRKDIDLIIWGEFSNDKLKAKGKNVSRVNLKFTYGHPDDRKGRIGKMLLLDFKSKLAKEEYWKIVEDDSLKDVSIISNDMFNMAIYIIAVIFKIYGKIPESIELFEKLNESLQGRDDKFQSIMLPHLIDGYSLKVIECGMKDTKTGEEFCNKILSVDKDNFFALSVLPAFQYKNGKTEEAARLARKLLREHPHNPIIQVNAAFIKILGKEYKEAFKLYRRITKNNVNQLNFNPQEVIRFLYEEYDTLKDPAMLYAIGVISNSFGDNKLAKKALKDFLKKGDKLNQKEMYRFARKLVKRIG